MVIVCFCKICLASDFAASVLLIRFSPFDGLNKVAFLWSFLISKPICAETHQSTLHSPREFWDFGRFNWLQTTYRVRECVCSLESHFGVLARLDAPLMRDSTMMCRNGVVTKDSSLLRFAELLVQHGLLRHRVCHLCHLLQTSAQLDRRGWDMHS